MESESSMEPSMPVLVLSYKPRSIHTPHPCRIASMAESALDGSALGRVRVVTPPVFIVTVDSRDVSLCPFWQFPVSFLETRAPI